MRLPYVRGSKTAVKLLTPEDSFAASFLYSMANFNPLPLFPPANAGDDVIRHATMTHGEIPCQVGPEITNIHPHVDLGPDMADVQMDDLFLPDPGPGKRV